MRERGVAIGLLLVVLGVPGAVDADPVKDAIKAKRIHDRLDIEVKTDANQKLVLQYRVDRETTSPKDFPTGLVFVASDEIRVTFPHFNPLEYQAVASVTETDDPAHAALTQLLKALTSVAGILRPDLADKFKLAFEPVNRVVGGAPDPCPQLRDAQAGLRRMIDALYPSELSATVLRASVGGKFFIRDNPVSG